VVYTFYFAGKLDSHLKKAFVDVVLRDLFSRIAEILFCF